MLSVWIKFRSERLHSWPDAPSDLLHAHLRQPHRHLFHVRVEVRVDDSQRQISFEALRQNAWNCWNEAIPVESFHSCEEMALRLGNALTTLDPGLDIWSIDVSEDGESGASWKYIPVELEEEELAGPSYG